MSDCPNKLSPQQKTESSAMTQLWYMPVDTDEYAPCTNVPIAENNTKAVRQPILRIKLGGLS